jgi:hypothetical protein
MMHGAPALVLAQHLGRSLRFKGSPVCDRPRSSILCDANAVPDRSPIAMLSCKEAGSGAIKGIVTAAYLLTPHLPELEAGYREWS